MLQALFRMYGYFGAEIMRAVRSRIIGKSKDILFLLDCYPVWGDASHRGYAG